MENEYEVVDPTNDTEVTENTDEDSEEFEDSEESEETGELEAEVKKATAPLYARMKQAEAEAKALKAKLANSDESVEKADNLSTKDIYALMEAKVPEEDIGDVQEYATLKNISVSEALKSNVVKTILSDKDEQRQTASAANVKTSKRGSGQVAADILLANARKGEMPEKDDDIDRLIEARKGK